MYIQAKNSMNGLFVNNLVTNSGTDITSVSNLMNNATYGKALSKYTIEAVAQNSSQATHIEETVAGTAFLAKFDSTYDDLKEATTDLKESISDKSSDLLAATQTFVQNYNDTTKFLNAQTSSTTTRLNTLQSSLSLASGAGSNDLMKIGISQGKDGTLRINQKTFNQALEKNSKFVERTLDNLANRTTVSIKLADDTSKSKLLSEQTKLNSSKSKLEDVTYEDLGMLAKNSTSLNNYYYALSNSGIFMDISS